MLISLSVAALSDGRLPNRGIEQELDLDAAIMQELMRKAAGLMFHRLIRHIILDPDQRSPTRPRLISEKRGGRTVFK